MQWQNSEEKWIVGMLARKSYINYIYEEPWKVFKFKGFKSHFTLCTGVFQSHVFMCTEKCLVPEEARRMLVLELQAFVSCHMGTGS